MAIKVINGQAVVVPEQTSPKEPAPTIPKPSSQTPVFTQKDPGLILQSLLGLVPGANEAVQAWNPQITPQERANKLQSALFQASPGGVGVGLLKGLAGIPFRAGLSVSDLFGGPKQLNVPLIGPQQSYQENYRQSRQAGGSPLVSGGLAGAQGLFDILLPSLLKGGGKPATEPITTPQALPNEILNTLIQEKKANPVVSEQPSVPPPQPNVPQPEVVPPIKKGNNFYNLNPYTFESTKIERMGPAGQEIVMRGRRVEYTNNKVMGELKSLNNTIGLDKLSGTDQLNLRQVLEGKAQPQSDVVAKIAPQVRDIFNQYGQDTGVNMIQDYFPRRLNEAGRKFYELPQNKDALITQLEQQGFNRLDAVRVVESGLKKGSFEFERMLPSVPDKFRMTPIEEIKSWESEMARRKGVIEQFGPKDEAVKNLLNEVGKGAKNEGQLKQQAQAYVDRMAGRVSNASDYDKAINGLNTTMVISKIDPTTTVGNELQAHFGSYLKYGPRGVYDATFGSGGRALVNELGLDQIKGKFETEAGTKSIAAKWMKAMGMESSEIRGKSRAVQAVDGEIQRAFNDLLQDPTNSQAKKILNDHAMYVDDKVLLQDLRSGKISDPERAFGIADGVRRIMTAPTTGERPAWSNKGLGRMSYTFKSYLNGTLQLLKDAPVERQLAYLLVLGPISGIPLAVLRSMISGKPINGPLDLYLKGATAGPASLYDIFRALTVNPAGYVAGSGQPILDFLTSKNKAKSAAQNLPFQRLFINKLFPPKQ